MTEIVQQIAALKHNLTASGFDTSKLCYLLTDYEWEAMMRWATTVTQNPRESVGPSGEVEVYGMKVRKRDAVTASGDE